MELDNCKCGRRHYCAVESVFCGRDAAEQLNKIANRFKKALLVGDKNTVKAFTDNCGSFDGLRYTSVIFGATPLLVPDESAVAAIEGGCTADVDCIIGVGGGTVNDLCKYVSHKHGLYYIYIATAPSMDGYASDGAALILGGMKVTLKAKPADIIICDTRVLKNAPLELIRAGIGDILGKYSCLNDWLLSNYIKGEYLCDEIYAAVLGCTKAVSDNIGAILNRDEAAVALLTEALIRVGIEMSYAGSSRPASGSEHHMAHFFEIYALEHGFKHRPHGIDVGEASYYTALLRDTILSSRFCFDFAFEEKSFFESIKTLLPKACAGIMELQKETALHGNKNGRFDAEGIRAVLEKAPRAVRMKELLCEAGLPPQELKEYYGADVVNNALKYGKELKDRFTVLWLYEYLGWEIFKV